MPDGHARGSAAYRGLTLAMVFAGFSTFSLLYSVQPLLPLFSSQYHLTAEASSLSVSLATGPLAFGILIAGFVSDRVGRKPLMVFATLLSAALTIASALSPSWPVLLCFRFLTGCVLSGVPAVAMAYVSEEVDVGSVGAAMGLYIAGTAFGGMGGRIIASVVAEFGGWRLAVAVLGFTSLAMAEAFRRLAPAPRRFTPGAAVTGDFWKPLGDPVLLLLYGEAFVLMGAFVTLYNYAGFRLTEPPYRLNHAAVGAVFLLYILGSFSSAWFGTLAGKVGAGRVLWAAVIIFIAGVFITAAHALVLVVVGIGVVTIGFFGAHSVASGWVGRRAASNRGHASALYLFFYYLGSSVIGSLGGVAWTRGAWPGVTWLCVSLGVIAFVGAAALKFVRSSSKPSPKRD